MSHRHNGALRASQKGVIFIFKLKNKSNQNEKLSFQQWLGLQDIQDGKIKLDNKELAVLKVSPTNFKLKSQLEQKAILSQYKLFLKNISSKIQIVVSSKKTDVSSHISEIQRFAKDNPQLYEMSQDYINLIYQIVSEKGATTKDFYIIIENDNNAENEIMKAKEYLSGCGNEVDKCTKEEIFYLIKNYTNKRLENLV